MVVRLDEGYPRKSSNSMSERSKARRVQASLTSGLADADYGFHQNWGEIRRTMTVLGLFRGVPSPSLSRRLLICQEESLLPVDERVRPLPHWLFPRYSGHRWYIPLYQPIGKLVEPCGVRTFC